MSVREKLGAIEPELVADLALARAAFDGKIPWAKAGDWEAGNKGIYAQPGCVWTHYTPPKGRGSGH